MMKLFQAGLILALLGAVPAHAQNPVTSLREVKIPLGTLTLTSGATGATDWRPVTTFGSIDHALEFNMTGAPSAMTTELQCRTGASVVTVMATSTAITGAAIGGSGVCADVRAFVTSTTGTAGTVTLTYYGTAPTPYPGYTVTTGVTTSSSAAASAIAASSGAIYGITASSTLNTSGTVVWLNFFNVAAASVTPGSTTPLFSIPVIGTTGLPISPPWEWPIPYAALSVNCTTLRGGSTKTQNVCEYIVVRK